MSITTRDDGATVHYPKDPNKFEFDEEVASCFDSMARRSIPLYEEAHRVHTSVLQNVLEKASVTLLDIGASRGHFFKQVCVQLGVSPAKGRAGLRALAVDLSKDMLRLLAEEMPWVETLCLPAEQISTALKEPIQADIVCIFYVLQFISDPLARKAVIAEAFRQLRPGGVLLIGQKEEVPATVSVCFIEAYHGFRRYHGYTREEIRAKTEALRNSMWVGTRSTLEAMTDDAGFYPLIETTRWLQFATYMTRKPL